MLRVDVLTLFPGIFRGFLSESLVKRCVERGLVSFHFCDWRVFAKDRHRSVDDLPYGGGPGMVLRPEPIFEAVEALGVDKPRPGLRRIMLSPQGKLLTQSVLSDLARARRLVLLCGRYEGFDERVRIGLGFEELSIGDYVIAGGELAAMVVIEGVLRLLPGAVGCEASVRDESFQQAEKACGVLLDWPQYTRPAVFRGMAVPEVLLSGNHERIAQWRREQALRRTRERRPDLGATTTETEGGGR